MSLMTRELRQIWDALRASNGHRDEALAAVRICRLRGIRDIRIPFEYPVSVLAGPNGCGKSTVLFACACAYRVPGGNPRHLTPGSLFPDFTSRQEGVSSDAPQRTQIDFQYLHHGDDVSMSWKRGMTWRRSFPSRNGERQPERPVYLRTLANLANPSEVRSLLRLGRRQVRTATSTDPLSILCEDAVAEGVIRGVLDVLNVELDLEHGDVVIGRNSGRDEFPGHVRTLAKFGRLSNFILVLDGDSRELEERLETVAERQGHAAHVLFLPGDGPPEQWLWQTVRERPDAYAERLGITATDMQRSMRHLEGLVDGAVQRRQDMAKVAVNALAHRVERTVAEFARIVGRHEARTEALFELVDGLKKLIEQWRRW